MEWVVALVGCVLSGAISYRMGVRTERGRHARWNEIRKLEMEDRRRVGGVTLRRFRITR